MDERIIVSMTTYSKRVANIPAVLETIFAQTLLPDLVVINFAIDEVIPDNVQSYINSHNIELNRVPDTKVYKKILPTLKKYPNDCIISIDDDFLYPKEMIEDFMDIHKRYPDHPISGNREVLFEMQCHCGCASLIKASFLGDYIDQIDVEVMKNCPSDDLTYTYLANKAGNAYIRTKGLYFVNMKPININDNGGVTSSLGFKGIVNSYKYLCNRFGPIDNKVKSYIKNDSYMAELMNEIFQRSILIQNRKYERVLSSYPYRLGRFLLKPAYWFRGFISHTKL